MYRFGRHSTVFAMASSLVAGLVGQAAPVLAGTCSVQATGTGSGAAVQIHATANCSGGVQAIRFSLDGIPITEVKSSVAEIRFPSLRGLTIAVGGAIASAV